MSDAAERLLSLTPKELAKLPADVREKIEAVREQVLAANRLRTVQVARDSLLAFTEMSMPDPAQPGDARKTRYRARPVHKLLIEKLEAVERGEILRLCISVQPRVGKSELVSKKFPAWAMGRDPYRQFIVTSYGEELAKEFGRDVRATMQSPFYGQVFPEVTLRRGSRAMDRLQTEAGGIASFVGAGGALTGRGADCVVPYCTVATPYGIIPIGKIRVGDKVYGYDHETGKRRWARVEAVSAKLTSKPVIRLRGLQCTADHRVYVEGAGYVVAESAQDVPELWRTESPPRTNVQGMSERARRAVGDTAVPAVRPVGPTAKIRAREINQPVRFGCKDVLFAGVQPGLPPGEPATQNGSWQVRSLRRRAPGQASKEVLFPRLLHAAKGVASLVRGILRSVSAFTRVCGEPRWGLSTVWDAQGPDGYTPHRPRCLAEHRGELSDSVPAVPQAVSHVHGTSADDLERLLSGEGRYVVDIQTDTANFFCEGILVHNCLLVDDIIKDSEQARSRATKDGHWEWFTRVALSRVMGRGGAVVITMTRWAEDDLVGRLTDPELGYVSEAEAAKWEVINIPAFADEDDPLGREPGEILWEERTPRAFLESFRALDPAGFAALYMGRPAPPEGNFFRRKDILPYQAHELPRNLRFYAASDHAISTAQNRDSTCMGVVGVDEEDTIWILPDLVWAKLPADDQVEAMLALMGQHKPLVWWAEKGHISKSIGPFLRKRMLEEQVFCTISEKTPVKDKQTRAQSIQARMSMGKVRFPSFAPWYQDAVEQLLNFPNGAHDDFCVAEGTLICMADGSQKPIESVETGEYVFTPTGGHQVTDSQRTDAAADVFRVKFDDGTYLVATGNHPVGAGNGEFVRVDRLTQGSLVSCVEHSIQEVTAWPNEELLKQTCGNTKDTVTADTLTASTRTTVATFMRRSLDGVSYIGTYGKMLMGKFPLASTFTTKTKTPLTTTSTTWNVCPQVSIGRSICENAAKRRSIWHALTGYVPSPQSGISQTKVGSGTAKWSSELGTKENVPRKHASSAVRRLKRLFLTEPLTVARNAVTKHGMKRTTNELFQPERSELAMFAGRSTGTRNVPRGIAALSVGTKSVVAVDRLPEKRPVYNLTVETAHVYYANGTLTHNCDFIAWIGLGLSTQVRAQGAAPRKDKSPPSGSLEWILDSANRIRRRNKSTENHERYLH